MEHQAYIIEQPACTQRQQPVNICTFVLVKQASTFVVVKEENQIVRKPGLQQPSKKRE
jgi:hypothetical protein